MSPPLTSYIQSVFFASLSLMLSIDFSFLILDVLPFRREAESDMCRFTIRHCRSRRFYLFSPLSDKGLLPAIFLIVGSQFRSTPPRIAGPTLECRPSYFFKSISLFFYLILLFIFCWCITQEQGMEMTFNLCMCNVLSLISDPMLQFSCVSPVKEEEDKIRELPLRATMDDWRANAS